MSMRDEFEAWVKNNWPAQSLERFNPLHGVTEGEYTGLTVQHCWEAWQASRAAIEVELPDWFEPYSGSNEHAYWRIEVDAAIKEIGIKVKP